MDVQHTALDLPEADLARLAKASDSAAPSLGRTISLVVPLMLASVGALLLASGWSLGVMILGPILLASGTGALLGLLCARLLIRGAQR